MNTYPYCVVRIDRSTPYIVQSQDRRARYEVFMQAQEEFNSYELDEECGIVWCHNHEAAQAMLAHLLALFPRNSYAICKTMEVAYIPETPAIKAVYTEQGLIPA